MWIFLDLSRSSVNDDHSHWELPQPLHRARQLLRQRLRLQL